MSDALLKQYNLLPKELQKEVQNYIEYLLFRTKKTNSGTSDKKAVCKRSGDFTAEFRATDRLDTKTTIREIQDLFTYDKGWASEEEMLADMAVFRRKRSV